MPTRTAAAPCRSPSMGDMIAPETQRRVRMKVGAHVVALEVNRRTPGAITPEAMQTVRREAVDAVRDAIIEIARACQ